MMKKLLSVGIMVAMMAAMSITAFAADGSEPTAPEGGTATVQSIDGITWNTTGDDDALAVDSDTDGANIDVWAKVVDSTSTIYKLDVSWGEMKFVYNSGAGQWNPTTHAYDSTGAASWTATYVDGTNNKINVTNHSNHAVDAGFSYAASGVPFNAVSTSDNAVVGNFFATNADALTASTVMTGTYTAGALTNNVLNKLTDNKIILDTADKYNTVPAGTSATNVESGARSSDVFFAFSGSPDAGKGASLATFTKVGVITVNIIPDNTVQSSYGTYVS